MVGTIRGDVGSAPPEDLVTGLQEEKMTMGHGDSAHLLEAGARHLRGGCARRSEASLRIGGRALCRKT